MEIRNEIESLALWYIPVFTVMAIISAIFSGYAKEIVEHSDMSPGTTISLLSVTGALIKLVDNLVVGIWLFIRGRKDGGRASLWLFFGIVAHFFAALIYIALKIYEQQKAYNKALKRDSAKNAAPLS